jgi:hypothetical protein
MKFKVRINSCSFSFPTILKGDALFLAATVQQWDKAITDNMDKTLAEFKLRGWATAPSAMLPRPSRSTWPVAPVSAWPTPNNLSFSLNLKTRY